MSVDLSIIDHEHRTWAKLTDFSPRWFGVEGYGFALRQAIRERQRGWGLDPSGRLDGSTYRRIRTEIRSKLPPRTPPPVDEKAPSWIVVNGVMVPIQWPRVVLWWEEGGLAADPGTYGVVNEPRNVEIFYTHWDVCRESADCIDVLNRRKISVTYLIDNDGTLYQTMDANHRPFHLRDRWANARSIGVEISNAYYPKYQPWYEEHGFGERPVMEGVRVHGVELDPFLGFYPVQLECLSALWAACSDAYDIPLQVPCAPDGSQCEAVHPEVLAGTYRGFASHFHRRRGKIDCAGLDDFAVLRRAQEILG